VVLVVRALLEGHAVRLRVLLEAELILGLGAPRTVSASGGLYVLGGKITTPDTMTAHFEFERCPVSWRHRMWGAEEYTPEINNGVMFFGEKGSVWVSDNKWVHIPKGKGAERTVNDAKADSGTLHMAEFLEVNKPHPIVLIEVIKGMLTGSTPELGETHVVRK
jgi:hypothetical protein